MLRIGFACLGLFFSTFSLAQLSSGIDETANLPFWQWAENDISVRLVQRLPDQSRAYFAARGFVGEEVKAIAQHCFFQTVVKNTSSEDHDVVIKYNLNDWRIRHKKHYYQLKNREQWKMIWLRHKTAMAPSIAFNWSLLPSQQTLKAQDYNWGMTVLEVPHGAVFELELKWARNGKLHTALLTNLKCARDIQIEPGEPL